MASAIKFGTSGWRAIVAEDFTVANIRLAVAGIAEYVKTQPKPHGALPPQEAKAASSGAPVLVGRDPRFLGEMFVDEAARVLAGAGVTPVVIPDPAPTPAISYAVRTLKTSGALNFTASHNPPEYNGIKYSTSDGAPALPEVTRQIEAAVNRIADGGEKIPKADSPAGGFETTDVRESFLKRLGELVDLKVIASSGIKVVFDPFKQLDSSTTREHGGAGLGLTIAQRIAQALGGDVNAESEVGKGSRFFVTLPAPHS